MNETDKRTLERLDGLLAEARRSPQPLPPGLEARVLADAAREQPRPGQLRSGPRRGPGMGGWFAALGGWPAFGTLAAASVAGFWIGIAPPEAVGDPALLLLAPADGFEHAAGWDGFGWDAEEVQE